MPELKILRLTVSCLYPKVQRLFFLWFYMSATEERLRPRAQPNGRGYIFVHFQVATDLFLRPEV
ncbi:MAG: hypothetical protein A2V67_06150 [Deltaproteobacteria bacterium RBG_13_61_14]|nr:MAG: hypothetical protein A2V67_06150 [Deltaproteobacteria bacterium RBG_13_61_14]